MSNSDTGKEQKNTQDGKIRIEYANGRILIFDENGDCRIIIGNLE